MTASYYMRGKKNALAGSGRGHSSAEDADRGAMAGGGLLGDTSTGTSTANNSSSSTPASFSGAGGQASGAESDGKMDIDSASTTSSPRKRKRGTGSSDAENKPSSSGDSNEPDGSGSKNYPSIDANDMPKLLEVIEKEFSLEILLKNQERKTIEAERAKVEVSIKQLEQSVFAGDGAYHDTPNRYHNYYGHFLEYGKPSQHNGATTASSSSRPQRNAAMKAAARSNAGGHVCLAKNDQGKVVRVTCPDCHRYDFSNVQGFINHCRIAHKIEYASHDDAVRNCGVEVDLSEFGNDETTRPPTHSTRPGIQSILNTSSTLSGKLPETAREHPPPTYHAAAVLPPPSAPSSTPSSNNVSPHKRKLSTTSFDEESSYRALKAFNEYVASPVTTRARSQSFNAIIGNSDLHIALASGASHPFAQPVRRHTRRNSVSGPSQKNMAASHSKRHRVPTRRTMENGIPSPSETDSATPVLKHLHKFTSGALDYDIEGFVEEMRREKHNMMLLGDDLSVSGDSDSDEKVENKKKPNAGARRPTGGHRTPANYAPPMAGLVEVPATRLRNRQQREKERIATEAKTKSQATSSGKASLETTPVPKATDEKKEDDVVDITTSDTSNVVSHRLGVRTRRRQPSNRTPSKPLKKSPMEEQSFLSTFPLRTKNRRRRSSTNASMLPPISTDSVVKKEDDGLDSDETSSDDEPGKPRRAAGVDGTMTPTGHNAERGFVGPSCGKDAPNVQYVSPVKEKHPKLPARPDLVDGSRYYVKRRIKIGNTSKFIPESKRSPKMSKYTHKWMIYFVSPPYSAPISTFLSSVTIFLDESFPLPRIIELRVPPFRWVSYGWGEFNLNIRLAFCDPVKNKPIDVVHPLKLDSGRTGREILGYEGYFDVELDRNSKFLAGEPGVEYDEIPKLAEAEKAGNANSSANKVKGREEELDADTIRVAQPREMITIGQHSVKNGTDKRPLLPKNPSFKSDDSVANKGSDDDDAEIRQIVDKLEPYSVQLHQAAKKHPLVSTNSGKSPYSIAPSNQVFLSWNHGRQKSVEWHRARLVDGDVLASLGNAAREVATDILSTKGIVFWCRRNQYGPPQASEPPVSGEDTTKYCRFCGMIADSPPQKGKKRQKSSYSVDAYCRCGQNMAVSLAGLKTVSSVKDMITRNRAVRRPSTSSQKVVSLKPADIRALLLQTDVNLLRWVWSAIVQLNLPCAAPKVTPGDTHRSIGDALAATSLMTHSARIFINRLIDFVRQQSSVPEPEDDDEVVVVGLPSSARRDIPPATTAPLLITPVHILSAIRSTTEFDFLTNAGMAAASSQIAAGNSEAS